MLCSLDDLARFGDWQRDCHVFICPREYNQNLPLSHDGCSPQRLLWLGPPSDLTPEQLGGPTPSTLLFFVTGLTTADRSPGESSDGKMDEGQPMSGPGHLGAAWRVAFRLRFSLAPVGWRLRRARHGGALSWSTSIERSRSRVPRSGWSGISRGRRCRERAETACPALN